TDGEGLAELDAICIDGRSSELVERVLRATRAITTEAATFKLREGFAFLVQIDVVFTDVHDLERAATFAGIGLRNSISKHDSLRGHGLISDITKVEAQIGESIICGHLVLL